MKRLLFTLSFMLPACSLLLDTAEYTNSDRQSDGGVDAPAATTETGVPIDSGSLTDTNIALDAPAPDGCTLLIQDDFKGAVLNERWQAQGTTRLGTGEVVITEDLEYQIGTLSIAVPEAMRPVFELEARFDLSVSDPNTPQTSADGLTFAWLGEEQLALGAQGGDFGLCSDTFPPRTGLAFAFDMHDLNVTVLRNLQACETDLPTLAFTTIPATSTATISTRNSRVRTTWNGLTYDSLLPTRPEIKRVGFTAATGGLSTRLAITNVTIHVCK